MTYKTVLTTTLILGTLAGCGAPHLTQIVIPHGKTMVDIKRDYDECVYESVKAVPSSAVHVGPGVFAEIERPLITKNARDEVGSACLVARGYQQVPRLASEPEYRWF
jgi:hypothetical protein